MESESFKDKSKSPIFPVTSPSRQFIREKVRKRGLENAERMINKYAKRKRIVIKEFDVGDNVSVKILKTDRSSSDVCRVPCTVTKRKGNRVPSYELACEHGNLIRLVTASDLLPYPSLIKVDPEVKKNRITLRDAANKCSVISSHLKFSFVDAEKAAKMQHAIVEKKECFVQADVIKATVVRTIKLTLTQFHCLYPIMITSIYQYGREYLKQEMIQLLNFIIHAALIIGL